jgi:parallel beta-helix repeat protein
MVAVERKRRFGRREALGILGVGSIASLGVVSRPSAASATTTIVSVLDYGAVGDGVTDDTAAVQAALNARAGKDVYFPAGTYLCGGLTVKSGTTMRGDGDGSVILASPSLPANTDLLTNANTSTYTDKDISVRDLVFDGNNVGAGATQTRFAELVGFLRVTKVTVINCTVRNVQYIGLALGAVRGAQILGSEFTNCGYSGTTNNGGPTLWVGGLGTDNSQDVTISGCSFHDNRWHGTHLSAVKASISGCVYTNNQEAQVYSPRTLPADAASDITIDGNVFDTVRKHDISAHALELQGWRTAVTGNVIRNCDHGGIALTNMHDVTISGNIISNVNQALDYFVSSGIDIITLAASPDQPSGITVVGNRIFDDQATVTTNAAVSIIQSGPGAAVTNTLISENNLAGTAWRSGGAFNLPAGTFASSSVHRQNLGAGD